MGNHLRSETIKRIIAAQEPVPADVDTGLTAICEAYRAAENSVAWYSLRKIDERAANVARATAARFRVQLRGHLAQLVVTL